MIPGYRDTGVGGVGATGGGMAVRHGRQRIRGAVIAGHRGGGGADDGTGGERASERASERCLVR